MPTVSKTLMLYVTPKAKSKSIVRVRKSKVKPQTAVLTPETIAAIQAVDRGEFTYYDTGMDSLCAD
jgi:hypothetical protein